MGWADLSEFSVASPYASFTAGFAVGPPLPLTGSTATGETYLVKFMNVGGPFIPFVFSLK